MIRKNVTEEDKMEMAKRIKLAVNYLIVNEKAKNQKEIAEKMNASESTLSNAIKMRTRFTNYTICLRLSKAYDGIIRYEWLSKGEGPMTSDEEISANSGNSTQITWIPFITFVAIDEYVKSIVENKKSNVLPGKECH